MNGFMSSVLVSMLFALPAWAGASECQSLAVARWVLGEWVAGGEKSMVHEEWTELGPQTFEGAGSEILTIDGMVISTESLRMVEMEGGVFYIAKVAENELPVAFRLTGCDAGRLEFENPAHNFPRRLEYRRRADGGMTVVVSDGADKGFTLNFENSAAPARALESVLAAEDARFAAMTSANANEIAAWLADDLQYVHSSGRVEDREQLVASIAGGALRYLKITPLDRQVFMLGDRSAMVRGLGRFQIESNGKELDLQLRYLAIYDMGGHGHWRLRSWQSLRLPQGPG